MPIFELPSALRPATAGVGRLSVEGGTVGEALAALVARHAGLRAQLFDERGQLKRSVSLFLGDDDLRSLQGLQTKLAPKDLVLVVTAIAGG